MLVHSEWLTESLVSCGGQDYGRGRGRGRGRGGKADFMAFSYRAFGLNQAGYNALKDDRYEL